MKAFTITILVLILLAVVTAWAGWWSFSSDENEATIRIDRTEVRTDTKAASERAREVGEKAAEGTAGAARWIDESIRSDDNDVTVEADSELQPEPEPPAQTPAEQTVSEEPKPE